MVVVGGVLLSLPQVMEVELKLELLLIMIRSALNRRTNGRRLLAQAIVCVTVVGPLAAHNDIIRKWA